MTAFYFVFDKIVLVFYRKYNNHQSYILVLDRRFTCTASKQSKKPKKGRHCVQFSTLSWSLQGIFKIVSKYYPMARPWSEYVNKFLEVFRSKTSDQSKSIFHPLLTSQQLQQ